MNADNVQLTEPQNTGLPDSPAGQVSEAAVSPETPRDAPDLHETLLEGVSPDALTRAATASGAIDADASEPAEAVAAEPVTVETQAAPAEDLTVVASEPLPNVDANATVDAAIAAIEAIPDPLPDALPDTIGEVLPEPVAATLPEAVIKRSFLPVPALMDFRGLMDFSQAPNVADVMGQFGEVNATVFTYLRDEGAAALAHWQALFGARTPADAIRLQVDEIQRAADASLSCFSALTQRANRLGGSIGRP